VSLDLLEITHVTLYLFYRITTGSSTKEFTDVHKGGSDLFTVVVFNRADSRTTVSYLPLLLVHV